ncbi:MAG: selenium cofactor biosynthesis protein YqeC [Gammaproteobacteria bacterium]
MSNLLPDLLGARSGIVCAIGAGGKKSTLYKIANAHDGPLAITTTVFCSHFPDDLNLMTIIGEGDSLASRLSALGQTHRRIGYAGPSSKPGRYAGVDPSLIHLVHQQTGRALTLVKADGARMRWLKAPKAGEPVIPDGCTTVIPVLSARALGQPMSARIAHRLERVAAVMGIGDADIVSPIHLARLLSADDGLLRGLRRSHGPSDSHGKDQPQVVPLINMVDNSATEKLAREAATAALEMTDRFDRVVLACMRSDDNPVVAVLER